MPGRIRRSLSYANVMSTIAVFAVLGGGAWAAATIGAGDIERNAVRSKHIKKKAVKSKQVKNGSIKRVDLDVDGLPAANVIVRHGNIQENVPQDVHVNVGAMCEAGERAVGGGAAFESFGGDEITRVSHPATSTDGLSFGKPDDGEVANAWFAAIEHSSASPKDAVAYVVCASP